MENHKAGHSRKRGHCSNGADLENNHNQWAVCPAHRGLCKATHLEHSGAFHLGGAFSRNSICMPCWPQVSVIEWKVGMKPVSVQGTFPASLLSAHLLLLSLSGPPPSASASPLNSLPSPPHCLPLSRGPDADQCTARAGGEPSATTQAHPGLVSPS